MSTFSGMLRMSMISSLLNFDSTTYQCTSSLDYAFPAANNLPVIINFPSNIPQNFTRAPRTCISISKKWELHSSLQVENTVLTDEDKDKWDACREALTTFEFSIEERDKMLGKAFGHIHSPYWSEERKKEVPSSEAVNEILNFLRGLTLTKEDIRKLLKKFPEVLGCSLENELKNNIQILEKDWGIKGKTLRNLLLRNPKVLGYNVDCKGDCMAQCTRCWVRF